MLPPNILRRIRAAYPVSDESLRLLSEHLTPCDFPRRYKLITEGARYPLAYFLEEGLTRSYWLVDGQEITTSFATEGAIMFSMDELYYDRPSEEFIETIEPCRCYSIPLNTLRHLFDTNIELANWGRVIHQDEYRRLHRSHKERLTLPARERYEKFQEQFPEVCLRSPLGYIASYLGITLSTLSRLSSKI